MRPVLLLSGSAAVLLAASLTACGSSATTAPGSPGSAGPAGATTVQVAVTDDGCTAEPASVTAGPVTFAITNKGSAKVTEAELMQGDKILGEKENLAPGLSGSFSLSLKPGNYTLYCPGAKTDRVPFTVTAGGSTSAAASGPLAQTAE